jgi:hypothetical protein
MGFLLLRAAGAAINGVEELAGDLGRNAKCD